MILDSAEEPMKTAKTSSFLIAPMGVTRVFSAESIISIEGIEGVRYERTKTPFLTHGQMPLAWKRMKGSLRNRHSGPVHFWGLTNYLDAFVAEVVVPRVHRAGVQGSYGFG